MEGDKMSQGRFLDTLSKRVQLFSNLNDVLIQQQHALINGESRQIHHFAETELKCMEEIHQVETQWDELIQKFRNQMNQPEATTENIASYFLDIKSIPVALEKLENLKMLAEEITITKRNNALLLHNSISLIRNTLKFLQGNRPADSFYSLRRQTYNKNIILNKKL
jgi:flagellar biosynthesis/type III secretory pathway chaperone